MSKKRRKNRYDSEQGDLVKGYVPPISRSFLVVDFFKKEIKKMLRKNTGLYVLYHNDELYYVGITGRDLFERLYYHTTDKHKNKWNKFSVFIIAKSKYLKHIETMAHLISNPPANVWKGRFKEHYQYDKKIKKMVKEASKLIEDIKKGG